MPREVSVSLDQFFRPQPGGIATYVRGLIKGLSSLSNESFQLTGIVPAGTPRQPLDDLRVRTASATLPVGLLTRAWAHWAIGVPATSEVVHATSLAGPYRGGSSHAVHSLALHDLLWRDEPDTSTPRGIRFHEARLAMLRRREDVRVIVTAPGLRERLIAEGFASSRLHESRFGVDDDDVVPESAQRVAALLGEYGVQGPYTLYAGTREPRKNLDRLVAAHARARADHEELGPLVVVGPPGWGSVELGESIVLGEVSRAMLKGLLRESSVVAYVPRAEGFGLPPVEALHQGARVVASATTPSVAHNSTVVVVDAMDVAAIEAGLEFALT
ncbi:MAG TPA: glycosyltransferase, partial [Acidimicrobiales bacterium]|nr:glycosyltransferase [Acidimicrobiales bacterium]